MRILHVSLSDPMKHTGGLNRYCRDLMQAESELGNDVFGLYAGSHFSLSQKIKRIRKNEYVLVGALPKALTYGVNDPKAFMVSIDPKIYADFLDLTSPDIIHVHSIMGIHKEFFTEANKKNIKMLFTTHDYYPICFRCVMVNNAGNLCEKHNMTDCARCNYQAGISVLEQYVISSRFYEFIKGSYPVVTLKRVLLSRVALGSHHDNTNENTECIDVVAYNNLSEYYRQMLKIISNIHCNSELAKKYYSKEFDSLNYYVAHISKAGLTYKKHVCSKGLRISYLGGLNVHKGYFVLLEALKCLNDKQGWICNMYGYGLEKKTTDYFGNRVKYIGYITDAEEIWAETDLLVVPSQWPETFGYVVLEALVRGVPVICSNLVGAKELLGLIGEQCTFTYNNPSELAQIITRFFDADYYKKIVDELAMLSLPTEMSSHASNIINIYEEILDGNKDLKDEMVFK